MSKTERLQALELLEKAPENIQNDSALASDWLKQRMEISEEDLDIIYSEDYDEGQYDDFQSAPDYDGYTPPKLEWTCEQCGTIHEEKPVLRKATCLKHVSFCPDCDDYNQVVKK